MHPDNSFGCIFVCVFCLFLLFPKQRLRGGVLTFYVHKLVDVPGFPVAGGRSVAVAGGFGGRWPWLWLWLDRLGADAMRMVRAGTVSFFAGVLSCMLS